MRVDIIEGAEETRAARLYSDFRGDSIELSLAQCIPSNWSVARILTAHNHKAYTLRGLHYQEPGQAKIVTVVRGLLFDVIVDLREGSSTFRKWTSFSLPTGSAVRVPPGCAHGYLTMVPDTLLVYALSGMKNDDKGLAWDDSALAIDWPEKPLVISARDTQWRSL